MKRELIYAAVIVGVVGAVVVMAAGSIAPLGAQNEAADAEFGTITCKELVVRRYGALACATEINKFGVRVRGGDGRIAALHADGVGVVGEEGKGRVNVTVGEDGGAVTVFDKDGEGAAQMATGEYGGAVTVHGRGDPNTRAAMGVNEYGNGAVSTWDKNGYRLANLK